MSEEQISELIKKHTRKTKEIDDYGNRVYRVWLDIDQQHFKLAADCETKKQANWYRRQLAIGVLRLLTTPED
ncbi:MAG: hypothetical protein ACR2PH_07180 [Desulfobulbia bacterium]